MISALSPFFSKKPFSCAINTGYETVGNSGTPMRILSWAAPPAGAAPSITRTRNKKPSVLARFIFPPQVCRPSLKSQDLPYHNRDVCFQAKTQLAWPGFECGAVELAGVNIEVDQKTHPLSQSLFRLGKVLRLRSEATA